MGLKTRLLSDPEYDDYKDTRSQQIVATGVAVSISLGVLFSGLGLVLYSLRNVHLSVVLEKGE